MGDCKRIDRLPQEYMTSLMVDWCPHFSPDILQKVARAKYGGSKDDKLIVKVFLFLSVSTEEETLWIREKDLMKKIDEKSGPGDEKSYKKIRHNLLGIEAIGGELVPLDLIPAMVLELSGPRAGKLLEVRVCQAMLGQVIIPPLPLVPSSPPATHLPHCLGPHLRRQPCRAPSSPS